MPINTFFDESTARMRARKQMDGGAYSVRRRMKVLWLEIFSRTNRASRKKERVHKRIIVRIKIMRFNIRTDTTLISQIISIFFCIR